MTKTTTPDHRPGETCEHAARRTQHAPRPAGPEVPRTAPDRSRPGPVTAPRTPHPGRQRPSTSRTGGTWTDGPRGVAARRAGAHGAPGQASTGPVGAPTPKSATPLHEPTSGTGTDGSDDTAARWTGRPPHPPDGP
ncbi:hypothetical protein GCM10010348_37270 [Streptomyces anthocyanicus]|nr:hypothetical protein GCM10010348_37270 [Streptomyces anthocyanicus]